MAHLAKYAAGASGGVVRHDERTDKDKVVSRKNENIDSSRTFLNYNLAPPRKFNSVEKTVEDYTNREKIHLLQRKDVNIMCSWIVTLPKCLVNADEEEQKRFFTTTYDFLTERYGYKGADGECKNILTATVHLDEATPHLHFGFVPVAYDTKKERYTVSAKLVCGRSDLQSFHSDLSARMNRTFGRNIGIENGVTATKGNQSIEELKYQEAKKRVAEAESKLKCTETRLKSLQGRVLEQEGVNALRGKKTLTGALKGISYEDYISLKKTASYVDRAKKNITQLKQENESLRNQVSELKQEVNRASEVRFSKQALLQNKARKEIEEKYENYIYREAPLNADIYQITKNICCNVVKSQEKYIIRCPYSEIKKLDEVLQATLSRGKNRGLTR